MEKKWIAYQILRGVADCHQQKVHHGDIKTENVLVTSWNWVYLVDFASYKPTFLPEVSQGGKKLRTQLRWDILINHSHSHRTIRLISPSSLTHHLDEAVI